MQFSRFISGLIISPASSLSYYKQLHDSAEFHSSIVINSILTSGGGKRI